VASSCWNISVNLSNASQKISVVMQRSSFDSYTATLEKQSTNRARVLNILIQYKQMGESVFRNDLSSFLAFTSYSYLFDDEDRERLSTIIQDIRNDQVSYDQIRPFLHHAIIEMERYPAKQPNEFARSLYVNTLRGIGFFERYHEDVHYAREGFNLTMEEFDLRPHH
jgi:hypothetical protein